MGMTVEQIIALIKSEIKRNKTLSKGMEGKEEIRHLKLQNEHRYMTLKHLLWLIEKRMGESEEQKGARGPMNKGCELCNKPEKWAAVFGHERRFGFPYLFARKQFFEDGKIQAKYCPFCGRKLEEVKE